MVPLFLQVRLQNSHTQLCPPHLDPHFYLFTAETRLYIILQNNACHTVCYLAWRMFSPSVRCCCTPTSVNCPSLQIPSCHDPRLIDSGRTQKKQNEDKKNTFRASTKQLFVWHTHHYHVVSSGKRSQKSKARPSHPSNCSNSLVYNSVSSEATPAIDNNKILPISNKNCYANRCSSYYLLSTNGLAALAVAELRSDTRSVFSRGYLSADLENMFQKNDHLTVLNSWGFTGHFLILFDQYHPVYSSHYLVLFIQG